MHSGRSSAWPGAFHQSLSSYRVGREVGQSAKKTPTSHIEVYLRLSQRNEPQRLLQMFFGRWGALGPVSLSAIIGLRAPVSLQDCRQSRFQWPSCPHLKHVFSERAALTQASWVLSLAWVFARVRNPEVVLGLRLLPVIRLFHVVPESFSSLLP